LIAIKCSTRTINIEASDNLRDRVVKAEDNLNMAGWILADDGNGILGANGSAKLLAYEQTSGKD
jgi:hypothetical protein